MPNNPTAADRAAAKEIVSMLRSLPRAPSGRLLFSGDPKHDVIAEIVAGCMAPERGRVERMLSLCQAMNADGCKSIELASVKHYLQPPASETEDQANAK